MDNLVIEMEESQVFTEFKNAVTDGIQEIGAFDDLRNRE